MSPFYLASCSWVGLSLMKKTASRLEKWAPKGQGWPQFFNLEKNPHIWVKKPPKQNV